ncbi:MAG: Rne/Rng family ribonuclease [Actinobacteria bacterium]|nr:Rne/Rng family ribonuclease [Actinomycetota bacterium]
MDNSELETSPLAPDHTPAPTVDTAADQAAAPSADLVERNDHDHDVDNDHDDDSDGTDAIADPTVSAAAKKRRRGSRGGKNRKKPARPQADGVEGSDADDEDDDADDADDADEAQHAPIIDTLEHHHPELPERMSENKPTADAADRALVRKPQIGDTRPAPAAANGAAAPSNANANAGGNGTGQRSRAKGGAKQPAGGRERAGGARAATDQVAVDEGVDERSETEAQRKKRRRGGKGRGTGTGTGSASVAVSRAQSLSEMDPDVLERRRGRERNGRPVGRYLMCVQVRPTLTQVAVLEGRTLIEHYVSRPADDVSQIHGNIYVGKVQNVLPGMEAAFVDIGTPKNAVLYRGDVQYEAEDIVEKNKEPRIEQMLRAKQLIVCQVTKNPIGAKGARLTQEVSLPGRFVVLIPNSKTYGISKRLPDDVRKRLRNILDRVKPAEHGLIVRTAAENASEHELRADMTRLLDQWNAIEAKAKKAQGPSLLYREPELAVRVIREEFNAEYRGVVIDDQRLYDDVKDYVSAFNPELADRVEYFDAVEDGLPLYERFHIHEQLHKALDRKVWLPSGGSLIIEHTEALTVIDVNTGKNVGTSNLEETVFRNNLEAAEEVAKQLRLRDIGGIVVIDFIDMEIKENRRKVVDSFRGALARDKTRTQVFDISELGLVEMTRKRIGEGLLVNFADQCPNCEGRGLVIDKAMLE